MARNAPFLPGPRRGPRATREKAAASTAGAGPAAPEALAPTPPPEDLRTVYGWLTRLTTDPAETEQLLTDILRRSRTAGPAWLRDAPEVTRLQFQTISSVLRLRGVL